MGVLTFILGIINGKKASKKGYLEGLKLGSIIILILLIFNLIFIRKFSLNTFVYYLVIIASTTIGSMIGINLRKS
jgi:putative membrane protein (TIGR04086 family)